MRRLRFIPIFILTAAACGGGAAPAVTSLAATPTSLAASATRTSTSPTTSTMVSSGVGEQELACSVAGGPRFPASLIAGPDLNREQFLATPMGQVLEGFFVGGPGAAEDMAFREAEGFSVVSDSLVLGYQDGLPWSRFVLESDRVAGWGGCTPNLVSGELVAYRWHLRADISPDTAEIPIVVEGGGCDPAMGMEEFDTEIVDIEVVESDDTVELVAWSRERHPGIGPSTCAPVGVEISAVAVLAAPLGNRALLDGGVIPALVIQP